MNFPKSKLSEESDIFDHIVLPLDEFSQEQIQQIQELLSDFDTYLLTVTQILGVVLL